MLSVDRDALICDLAETYHIYNYRALPVETLAALSFGLRPESRIKSAVRGVPYVSDTRLLVDIADGIRAIHFALTATEESTEPMMWQDKLYPKQHGPTTAHKFASSEDFKEIWYG